MNFLSHFRGAPSRGMRGARGAPPSRGAPRGGMGRAAPPPRPEAERYPSASYEDDYYRGSSTGYEAAPARPAQYEEYAEP